MTKPFLIEDTQTEAPPVDVGSSIVISLQVGDPRWWPARVIHTDGGSPARLAVKYDRGNGMIEERENVVHETDPYLDDPLYRENLASGEGAIWKHTPEMYRLYQRIGELERKLAERQLAERQRTNKPIASRSQFEPVET